MDADSSNPGWNAAALADQLQAIASQSQRLMQHFLAEQQNWGQIGMGDASAVGDTFVELMSKMAADPTSVAQAQINLFNDSVALWQTAAKRLLLGRVQDAPAGKGDKRFKHADWTENAMFSFIRESYVVAAKSILSSVRGVKDLDPHTARKAEFYTRQCVDAISPSNFVATNPEVIGKTLESGGQNLLKGLENLLSDLDRGNGRLEISMSDDSAFELGRNVATTPGKVIFQNELMQLIQYEPTTAKVRKRPLLITPPWIRGAQSSSSRGSIRTNVSRRKVLRTTCRKARLPPSTRRLGKRASMRLATASGDAARLHPRLQRGTRR